MEIPFVLQVAREVGFGGGSECVAFELHRAWIALGMDVGILTSRATEPDAQVGVTLTAAWINHRVPRRLRHLAILFAVPLFTIAATLKLARDRSRKIVLSHGDSLAGDVCVVHAVNRACLEAKSQAGYHGWRLNPSNLWIAWRDRWMFGHGRYRRVVAISERVRRELQQYYNVPDDRIVTIPNGINLDRFNPSNRYKRAEVRRSLGISSDVPLILFVGSRFRIKGLKYAIEALAEMNTKAVLLVAGDDNARSFKKLAARLGVTDRVIFAGGVKNLPQVYAAADALLLPSLYETFALVCLEAMASGLPVVASPVGGIEDYLVDGKNGFHIQHDPTEIAAKLDRLLNDKILQAKIIEKGLATARDYSWERIAARYIDLFQELVNERSPEVCRTAHTKRSTIPAEAA